MRSHFCGREPGDLGVDGVVGSLQEVRLIPATGRHRIARRKLSALRDIASRNDGGAVALPEPARRAVSPNWTRAEGPILKQPQNAAEPTAAVDFAET